MAAPEARGSLQGLGIESELQLPTYATDTAKPDPSHLCDLHTLRDASQILNRLSHSRNSKDFYSEDPQ